MATMVQSTGITAAGSSYDKIPQGKYSHWYKLSITNYFSAESSSAVATEIQKEEMEVGNEENVDPNRPAGGQWSKPVAHDYSDFIMGSGAELNPSEFARWDAFAERFEWKEEYGDVIPRIPALEAQLFGDNKQNKAGIDFSS
jgi:hypothetical protein